MKYAVKIISLIISLVAASAAAESHAQPLNIISLPTAMVITDTMVNNYPRVNGKVNIVLMQMMCDLARGDKTQKDINDVLARNKAIASLISVDAKAFSLLMNGNTQKQRSACVSWLASSLFSEMDNEAYKEIRKVSESVPAKESQESSWKFWAETQDAPQTVEREVIVWNKEKFTNEAKVHLAVAKATAQLYSLIANDLNKNGVYSISELNLAVNNSIDSYAPEYLNAIKQMYSGVSNSVVKVETLEKGSFSLNDNRGHIMVKNESMMRLFWRGVTWLDQSKIMGKEYFINISLNPDTEDLSDLVVEPKKTESK